MNSDLSKLKEISLSKKKQKYVKKEKFIIARKTRTTIRFIEKCVHNFPNEYKVLKNRIIDCCYAILEYIYRANIFQDISEKKEVIVRIQMLNFYLEEALRKELISKKKFINYNNHLIEIDSMVRVWFKYEKIK